MFSTPFHQIHKYILLFTILLICVACSKPYEFKGTEFPNIRPAPEIAGVVGDEAFSLSNLQGKVVVAFFGFTYCPDVCPMTLAEVGQAYDQVEATSDDVAVVFVTVDPERDTPERLNDYVSAFNADFYGVHVPLADQEAAKKGYFVVAEKDFLDGDTDSDNYLVAHSDNIYLIDRAGKLRVVYRSSDLTVDDLASDVEHLLAN